ncbi:hypothetical protein [Sandaracinus amylolyticus]|uniref:hypothetical protein n=1 Tax=Sandaracinus amylolyticus TaxID=927083 RepID=UPI001F322EB5|nr:hypothetical protein [Sandaracinus amylolyticus]UJR84627.1 Hypothetical protein I5071_67060 [Sandaracinus amylolyticus]
MQSRATSFCVAALAMAFGFSGCTEGGTRPPGGGGDGGPRDAAVTNSPLRIEPADHRVAITSGASANVDYRAFLRETDGTEREVTSEVTWLATVPTLGSFSGARFTSMRDRGGRTDIRATMGSIEALTSLTISLERIVITEGTPADAPTRFGGTADPSRAPELVYPDDATMVPSNLGELEFHYRTAGSTLFELHVQAGVLDLRVYFGCPESVGDGCIYTPDRDVWESIATAAAGQGPITYRLRGVDDAGRLGETAERTITVSEEPITGGIYYWNAGAGRVDRFEFGVRGAQAEPFIDRQRTEATFCVGCHTVSRDGQRIAVGTDMPTTTLQVFDVATRNRIFSRGAGGGLGVMPSQPNFASFSPDHLQIATSAIAGLGILDGTTGDVIAEELGGGAASMPDWSPDGNHIAFVRYPAPPSIPGFALVDVNGVTSGEIVRLDRSGSGWTVGPTLVAGGGNNYYPAYSPDGEWIVFNRSESNSNSAGMGDAMNPSPTLDATLWIVPSSGTGTAMRLSRLAGLADSWAKWDPIRYRDRGRPLFWLTWTSRRAFGLRLEENARSQLWMAAFDPEAQAEGRDGSYPAFRLPFQDLESANHIGQWVTTVERLTCDDDTDCGGEFCVDGRCYSVPPLI